MRRWWHFKNWVASPTQQIRIDVWRNLQLPSQIHLYGHSMLDFPLVLWKPDTSSQMFLLACPNEGMASLFVHPVTMEQYRLLHNGLIDSAFMKCFCNEAWYKVQNFVQMFVTVTDWPDAVVLWRTTYSLFIYCLFGLTFFPFNSICPLWNVRPLCAPSHWSRSLARCWASAILKVILSVLFYATSFLVFQVFLWLKEPKDNSSISHHLTTASPFTWELVLPQVSHKSGSDSNMVFGPQQIFICILAS